MWRVYILLALLAAVPVRATPLEDRLREQLQSTTTQLREAQGKLATLEAAKTAAEAERDAAKAKASSNPDASRALTEARSANDSLRGEIATGKAALAAETARTGALSAQLATAQSELAQLKTSSGLTAKAQATALQQCLDANGRLVATGRDLVAIHIKRYGKRRYLPLQLARTSIENEAQAMGDRVNSDAIIVNTPSGAPK